MGKPVAIVCRRRRDAYDRIRALGGRVVCQTAGRLDDGRLVHIVQAGDLARAVRGHEYSRAEVLAGSNLSVDDELLLQTRVRP